MPVIFRPTGLPAGAAALPFGEGVISTPQWDDLIHIQPTSSLTPQQRRERARRLAIAIRNSGIPEWRREWTKVLTMLDNVEDALTTATVLGRLSMRFAPRISPAVGVMATADVILNSFITAMRFPYPGSIKKVKLLTQLKGTPTKTIVNAYKGVRPLRGFPSFGETLEILQTTDWLFGVGLQIGPIFGAIESWAVKTGAAIYSAAGGGYITPVVQSLWNGLKALPSLFRSARHLGLDVEATVFHCAAAIPAALMTLPNAGLPLPVQDFIAAHLDAPLVHAVPTDPITWEIIRELGGADPTTGRFPFPGEPTAITARDLDPILRAEGTLAAQEAVRAHELTPQGLYLGTCTGTSVLEVLDLWAGGPTGADLEPTADVRILGELLDRDLVIDGDDNRPAVQRWLDQAALELDPLTLRGLDTRDLNRIARQHGLRLVPRVSR